MPEGYKNLKKNENTNNTYEVSYHDTVRSYTSFFSVDVVIPTDTNLSVVFVGLFKSSIPNHKPVAGKALFFKHSCRLENIPNGSYCLLACGIEKSLNPIHYSEQSVDDILAKFKSGNMQILADKEEKFWNSVYAKVADSFGIIWELNYQK